MKYTCIRCGKEFEAKRKTSVCQDCHTAICVVCGKEFQLQTPWTQKTCSAKCRGIYRKESGIAKDAAEKAKETLLKRFGVSNASELQHFKKTCAYCGKEFETTSARQIYCNDVHYGNCPVCGKRVEIKDMYVGPQACFGECRNKLIEDTCLERYGDKCAVNSEYARQKAKQTCLEKYGVDHYSKTDEYKQKYEKTLVERYGVTNPLKNPKIVENLKATNREKYGGNSPMCSPDIVDKAKTTAIKNYNGVGMSSSTIFAKIKATNLERYGVECVLSNPEIHKKAMQNIDYDAKVKSTATTNIERYGVPYVIASKEIRDRVAQTNINKYGVDNVFKSDEIKQKISDTNIEKYGVANPMQSDCIKAKVAQTCSERYGTRNYGSSNEAIFNRVSDPLKFDKFLQFKSDVRDYIETNFKKPTLWDIADNIGVTISTVSYYVNLNSCQDLIKYRPLLMEDQVYKFVCNICKDYNVERHNRTAIAPFEIDIYIPELKLGFEVNPTYTHNSSISTIWSNKIIDRNYHKNKTVACNKVGIHLFHIFGYQWNHKQDIVKSMICVLCGAIPNKVYARNTVIREVSDSNSRYFLNQNHIQGYTKSKIRLGLYLDDTLVSLMTFSHPRGSLGYNKKYDSDVWELTRFCSLKDTIVVGGASKLFKYFISNNKFSKIISFSDSSYADGGVYKILGFNASSTTPPNYTWVNLQDDSALNRISCQKSKLKRLFGDGVDIENKTESEIMIEHGYVKIYNSGLIKWVYEYKNF